MFVEIFLCFVICFLGYYYLQNRYSYWSLRGVSGPKPTFLLGNLLTRLGISPAVIDPKWLIQYGKVYGVYNGLKPSLIIHDPELIKQVLIKDFSVFVNRSKLKAYHEMWNQNLIFSLNDQWKRVRTITSPAFSSRKLKDMYPLMDQCLEKLVKYLDNSISNGANVIDTKEVISGFTIDVIATTSFGTETDANGDRSKENPFLINGQKLFQFDRLRAGAVFLLPKFALNLLNLKTFFDPKVFEFFISYTRHILKERKQNNSVKRNDFVQLLLEASVDYSDLNNDKSAFLKSTNKTLTESEIIAQCIAFLVAGYETTAATISHCLFELSHNPDIQERLKEEIVQKLSSLNDKSDLYFEAVMTEMPYLDAIVKETLRKYPSITRLNRYVEIDGYNLGGIALNRNDTVEIPVYALHHCDEFFPEPEKFNPERFTGQNRHQVTPYTYLPFGDGPRNCIGMRFAYQNIKLCVVKLIHRYRFETTPKTPQKLAFKFGNPQLNSELFPLKIVPLTNELKLKM